MSTTFVLTWIGKIFWNQIPFFLEPFILLDNVFQGVRSRPMQARANRKTISLRFAWLRKLKNYLLLCHVLKCKSLWESLQSTENIKYSLMIAIKDNCELWVDFFRCKDLEKEKWMSSKVPIVGDQLTRKDWASSKWSFTSTYHSGSSYITAKMTLCRSKNWVVSVLTQWMPHEGQELLGEVQSLPCWK